MSVWSSLLQRPSPFMGDDTAVEWFSRIADRLLNGCHLMVGGKPHRFTEIEFYYNGEGHADPFAHCDPIQLENGRWYFHRSSGTYRSGSFKGVDLSFGDGTNHGGVLIRGLEDANGKLVDGPSLTVDYLLDATGASTVAALDRAIGTRQGWATGNALLLQEASGLEQRPLLRSGRVGLTLKKAKKGQEDKLCFILRSYRYLSQPRKISKGKQYLALALHMQGEPVQKIQQITGCTKNSIEKYIADYEAGRAEKDFSSYIGAELGPQELSRLHGTWHAAYGATLVR